MGILIAEIIPENEPSIASIFGGFGMGGSNNSPAPGSLKMLSDKIFPDKESAEKWITEECIPEFHKSVDEKYEGMKEKSGLFDMESIDKSIAEGKPLLAKNIVLIPIESFYSIKGIPYEKDLSKTVNEYHRPEEK